MCYTSLSTSEPVKKGSNLQAGHGVAGGTFLGGLCTQPIIQGWQEKLLHFFSSFDFIIYILLHTEE